MTAYQTYDFSIHYFFYDIKKRYFHIKSYKPLKNCPLFPEFDILGEDFSEYQ